MRQSDETGIVEEKMMNGEKTVRPAQNKQKTLSEIISEKRAGSIRSG